MKVELKHVHTVKKKLADGSVKLYYRHRLTGRPILGAPGTLEFQASYEEAGKPSRQTEAIFGKLISSFFSSKKFEKLSERTRSDYSDFRTAIEEEWANAPIDAFKDPRIKGDFREWRDQLSRKRGDRQADLIFACARRIVTFAVQDGKLPVNHLFDIEMLYSADRAEFIWLPEHIETFINYANMRMQLAVILALNLGRREGDLIRLTWGDFRGDVMMVTNKKSGRAVKFPAMVTQSLRDALETYRRSLGRIPHHSETILITADGAAWEDKQFRGTFSKTKNRAGLTDLHFHDLRGTAVTILAEMGCTEMQIASITGHSLKQVHAILEKYMARTRALNVAATLKLEQSWVAGVKLNMAGG